MALVGELVAHAHPVAGLHLTLDQTGLLELLETAGEQAIRHAGHRLLQLGEVQWPFRERIEDRPGPTAADQLHRAVVMPTDLFRVWLSPGRGQARGRLYFPPSVPVATA